MCDNVCILYVIITCLADVNPRPKCLLSENLGLGNFIERSKATLSISVQINQLINQMKSRHYCIIILVSSEKNISEKMIGSSEVSWRRSLSPRAGKERRHQRVPGKQREASLKCKQQPVRISHNSLHCGEAHHQTSRRRALCEMLHAQHILLSAKTRLRAAHCCSDDGQQCRKCE